MDIFYRWLIGDIGTPGDYQYQAIHGYSVLAVVLALVVVCIFAVSKKLTQQHKKAF